MGAKMTDDNRVLIAVLLDRSGSMSSIKTDTEGGFAAFIDKQRGLDRDVRVTLAQFDTEYDVVYTERALAEVPPLVLDPRGSTALYDAVGRLVSDVGAELAATPAEERPGTVIVVVLTDGHENASAEWTHEAVRKAICRQETEYAWTFVFLGANMDAVQIGQKLGFSADRSMTYVATPEGVDAAFAASGAYVARRTMAAPEATGAGFSDEDRVGAMGKGT